MEYIIAFSACCFLISLLMVFICGRANVSSAQSRVLRSLGRFNQASESTKHNNKDNKDPSLSRKERFHIIAHRILNSFSRVKQKNKPGSKDLSLASAGLTNWSYAEWRLIRYACSFFCGLLAIAVCKVLDLNIVTLVYIMMLSSLLGLFFPNYYLKMQTRRRQEEIVRTLPDTLDLIMVSVEAGLGFDAALFRVIEKQKGVLADEFNLVLQEVKMGRPRREALKDMASKNNVEDLSNFIASLIQADQLGVSIGSVLRNQAKQIRQKRRQRAQEQAHKAPVKMMLPLVLFIFPSIFIVVLGPAVIRIIDVFNR